MDSKWTKSFVPSGDDNPDSQDEATGSTLSAPNRRITGRRGEQAQAQRKPENVETDWKLLTSGIRAALELRTQDLNFESIYRATYKLQLRKLPVSNEVLSILRGWFEDVVAGRLRHTLAGNEDEEENDDIQQRNQGSLLLNALLKAHDEYMLSTKIILEMCKYLIRVDASFEFQVVGAFYHLFTLPLVETINDEEHQPEQEENRQENPEENPEEGTGKETIATAMIQALIQTINLDRKDKGKGTTPSRQTLQGCIRLFEPGLNSKSKFKSASKSESESKSAAPLYPTVAPLWDSIFAALVQTTEAYYEDKTTSWMTESPVAVYCQLMEASVVDETALCEEILPAEAASKVVNVMKHIFATRLGVELQSRMMTEENVVEGLSEEDVDTVKNLLRRLED